MMTWVKRSHLCCRIEWVGCFVDMIMNAKNFSSCQMRQVVMSRFEIKASRMWNTYSETFTRRLSEWAWPMWSTGKSRERGDWDSGLLTNLRTSLHGDVESNHLAHTTHVTEIRIAKFIDYHILDHVIWDFSPLWSNPISCRVNGPARTLACPFTLKPHCPQVWACLIHPTSCRIIEWMGRV